MTLYASVNGQRIAAPASIAIPFYRVWQGDVTLANAVTLTNPISLVIGNLTMRGVAYRQGIFAGLAQTHLVGGGGGWGSTLPAQCYANPTGLKLSTVLKDVAIQCGEQVSVPTDETIGSFYIRTEDIAQRVLAHFADDNWYVDTNGVTQIGQRPSSAISSPFTVVAYDPGQSSFDIATEDPASWMPGNTFTSSLVPTVQTISLTRITIDNNGVARLKVLGTG
jgi:hypothetical protein